MSLALSPRPSVHGLSFWLLLALTSAHPTCATADDSSSIPNWVAATNYLWFSVPITLNNLPNSSDAVPVTVEINLTELATKAIGKPNRLVDESSCMLVRIEDDGREIQEPLQVTPNHQARPGTRTLLKGTSDRVSYLSELGAHHTSPTFEQKATLCWIAQAGDKDAENYLLRFGALKTGAHVQVPYPPYNYRAFDQDGQASPLRQFPRMQIRPQTPMEGAVGIYEGADLIARYHTGPTWEDVRGGTIQYRRPFIYPLNGPHGVSLTGFGKPHDPTGSHAHHYSLWVAHAMVNGLDFWSERGGLIVHERFETLQSGPVFCRLVQNTTWTSRGSNFLAETRTVTAYRSKGDFRILDVDIALKPAGTNGVTFEKTSFGFLAARVAESMSVFDGGGAIVNSKGDINERQAHLKRAEWMDQSGPVTESEWGGVAILDHPDNFGHPTAWHCRNDGWAGAAFSLDHNYFLRPGELLKLKYRVLAHRHDAAKAAVALRYQAFAAEPRITVGPPSANDVPKQ